MPKVWTTELAEAAPGSCIKSEENNLQTHWAVASRAISDLNSQCQNADNSNPRNFAKEAAPEETPADPPPRSHSCFCVLYVISN